MQQGGNTGAPPPVEGPYSAIKTALPGAGGRMTTPGGSFLDRMRTVLRQAAEPIARCSPSSSAWGDTPNSTELAQIAEMERAAMQERLNGAAPTELAGELHNTGVPPRHLSFTPTGGSNCLKGKRRSGSSGKRRRSGSGKRKISHLGRTATAPAPTMLAVPAQQSSLPTSLPLKNHTNSLPVSIPLHGTGGAVLDQFNLAQENSAKRLKTATGNRAAMPLIPPDDGKCSSSDTETETELLHGNRLEAASDALRSDAVSPEGRGGNQGTAPPLELAAYLPTEVCDIVATFGGPRSLYMWQAECLCRPGVLQGRNLVYCAPTSGGKSLVAEVVILRRLLTTGRPALLVLPFISLCAEKSAHLRRILGPLGREVRDFFGPVTSAAPLGAATGVVVCTIEKANILVNRLLEDSTVGILSCVVIDELHMVGDEERGYQLELLLTKLRYAGAAAYDSEEEALTGQPIGLEEGIQIVGMSATLPNVDAVATWLGAELYFTDFRPVPLRQFLKVGNKIKDADGVVMRTLDLPKDWAQQDTDHVAWLTNETVAGGHSVLVFCASRAACAKTASFLATMLKVPERQRPWIPPPEGSASGVAGMLPSPPTRAAIVEALARVGEGPGSFSAELAEAVSLGVAFHHAGLDSEQRELVEIAFKCGAVSVLCATSTLAAGVNLPARRVIFRHPYVGRPGNLLDATRYRQMVGRAGRAGIDSEGESFLLALKDTPLSRLETLMRAAPAPIESCLTEDKRGMKRAMLEVVASGAVAAPVDVERYIQCTLLAATSEYKAVVETTKAALTWLGDRSRQFIFWDDKTGTYQATPFGKAALGSGLPPELCMHIRDDLARARESFVLTTELHLTYLCVPATEDIQPDWSRLLKMTQELKPADSSVASKVGLDMSYVVANARGFGARGTSTIASGQQSEQERVCRRFWAALVLNDMLQEMSLEEVHEKYGVVRGTVQGMQDRACRYAGMIAVFCERLGWHDLELLVSKFQGRVLHGVRPEMVCLMEIPYVKTHTARLLYKAGLRTPEAIAMVGDVERVVAILLAGRGDGGAASGAAGAQKSDEGARAQAQQQARRIIRAAKDLLGQRAKELKAAAAEALQLAGPQVIGKESDSPGAMVVTDLEEGLKDSFGRSTELISYDTSEPGVRDRRDFTALSNARRPVDGPHPATTYSSGVVQVTERQQHQQPPAPPHFQQQQQQEHQKPFLYPQVAVSAVSSVSALEAPWTYGNAVGVTPLIEVHHVAALRHHLESSQHPRFAFQFDVSPPPVQPAGNLLLPAAPIIRGGGASLPVQPQQQTAGLVYGVAVSWKDGQAFYIPFSLSTDPRVVQEVVLLFANPSLEKVTFDLKGQMAALHRAAAAVGGGGTFSALKVVPPFIDVRIASFLLNPDDSRLWDGPSDPVSSALLSKSSSSGSSQFTPETLGAEVLGPLGLAAATRVMQPLTHVGGRSTAASRGAAAGRQAAVAGAIFTTLRPRLEQDGLLRALMTIEMPIVPILVSMEYSGVGINSATISTQIPALRRRLVELENSAIAAAGGYSFNLASPEECSEALYGHLGLPPPPSAVPRRPAGSGSTTGGNSNVSNWSTKSEVLEDLKAAHPECALPGIISEHRTVSKLLVGCEELLLTATRSIHNGSIGRVHGTFHHTRAATGRLIMDNPNLQTLPRPLEFNVGATPPDGPAQRRQNVCNMRAGVVAPPGRVLLSADYCQLELRMLAHLSKDPVLIERLRDGQRDPFACLAAAWLNIHPPAQVTFDDRNRAKKLAYAIIYGMGRAATARELGLKGPGAENEAGRLADSFLAALPRLRGWIEQVKVGCRNTGQIRTLAGRLRRLGTRGEDHARVDRQAVNSVCQGSAADVAKLAMVAAVEAVTALGDGRGVARLVLQIHDEFLFEVDVGELRRVAAAVRGAMESVVQLAVPLRVRLAAGRSWGELEELPPDFI